MSVASRAEEENLGYPSMPDHALDDREFKILRSATSAFRRRDELEKALREEAAAGWVLLEKLDDARLRLQRPRAARAGDGKGAIDPYRSYYGMGPGAAVLVAMAIVIPLLGLLILGTFLLSATR